MPKIKKVKVSKKELKHDKFVDMAVDAYKDIKKHWQKYFIILAVLILVIIGINWYVSNARMKNMEASQLFFNGVQTFSEGNYDNAVTTMENIKKRYYGTESARKADYYIAASNMKMNNMDIAVEQFKKFSNSGSPNEILKANAYLHMGFIYSVKQMPDSTIYFMNQLIEKYPNSHARPDAMMRLASAYEQSMEIDKADNIYRTVIAHYPGTLYAQKADRYRKMLEGAIEVLSQQSRPVSETSVSETID